MGYFEVVILVGEMSYMLGKLVTYNRLRIDTDGEGVTTLIAFYGCPLDCKYCINKGLYEHKFVHCSVKQLYDKVVFDDLYYTYTGGGICFGGHEPLLQSEFIAEFIDYVKEQGKEWKFTIETSLNVELELVIKLLNKIDKWIIDIKDMNTYLYKQYTGVDNKNVKANLRYLVDHIEKSSVFIRIPLIKGINTLSDIEKSKKELLDLGFKTENLDIFEYVIRG